MQRVKQWFDDLMASAENEILMKAKLVVAVESKLEKKCHKIVKIQVVYQNFFLTLIGPLEDLVQQIGVSPGDAQLIQVLS